MFHISENQPFIDGNKRVASSASLTFLMRNGVLLGLSNDNLVDVVFAMAKGQLDKQAIAATLRNQTWANLGR